MELSLHVAHTPPSPSVNTVNPFLLHKKKKVKAHRLLLSCTHRRVVIQSRARESMREERGLSIFNPCPFHFSYPWDWSDFI